MQAADRVLLISEARQTVNPALPVPVLPSAEAEEEEGAGLRPDLSVQHVKLPQQYIEAAYPLVSCCSPWYCLGGTKPVPLCTLRNASLRFTSFTRHPALVLALARLPLPAPVV